MKGDCRVGNHICSRVHVRCYQLDYDAQRYFILCSPVNGVFVNVRRFFTYLI